MLSEFRTRVIAGQAEPQLLDALLERCRERQWRRARGRQRTDATPGLGAIRALNRVVGAAATMRQTFNKLAVVAPEWLRAHRRPEWLARYGPRMHDERVPTGEQARQAYARTVGMDGYTPLDAIDTAAAPAWLRQVPAVETRGHVWMQQYYRREEGVRGRTAADG